jgi:hypothetical protein
MENYALTLLLLGCLVLLVVVGYCILKLLAAFADIDDTFENDGCKHEKLTHVYTSPNSLYSRNTCNYCGEVVYKILKK